MTTPSERPTRAEIDRLANATLEREVVLQTRHQVELWAKTWGLSGRDLARLVLEMDTALHRIVDHQEMPMWEYEAKYGAWTATISDWSIARAAMLRDESEVKG